VVAPVVVRDVVQSREFVGRTEAFREVEVRARVTGFLLARPFDEGADVERGALLYRIDPDEFQANLNAAQAELKRAQATYESAASDLRRGEKLVGEGTISQSEFEKIKADALRAEADVDAAKAAVQRAQLDLSYTTIYASISGRVGVSAVDAGNLIGPDSGVLSTIVRQDPVYVTFPVSERQYLSFERLKDKPEMTPRLRLADGSSYPLGGELELLDNRVDPQTGTVDVRARFPNPDDLLLPGLFVTVELRTSEAQSRPVVRQSAVQQDQAGAFVLVVDQKNRVQTRRIITGDRVGSDWVVEEGLEGGEQVIVEGLQKVQPGAEVDPQPAGPGVQPQSPQMAE
jgi:membrane fusion protein (multidrug efflux system)